MSEDLRKPGFKSKFAKKAETSSLALVLVMLVEFLMFAFYPFVFLVIIPYKGYSYYSENFCGYNNDEKMVVLNKDIYVTYYLNWETDEEGDGSNKLFIPAGSTIEVSRVNMIDYPKKPACIGISFYYDENGNGYTLWDDISLNSLENPEEIIRDLDEIRNEEKQNNSNVFFRVGTGLIITIIVSAVAVLVLYLILKKNLTLHVAVASLLVVIVYVLLFQLGPVGANLYYHGE